MLYKNVTIELVYSRFSFVCVIYSVYTKKLIRSTLKVWCDHGQSYNWTKLYRNWFQNSLVVWTLYYFLVIVMHFITASMFHWNILICSLWQEEYLAQIKKIELIWFIFYLFLNIYYIPVHNAYDMYSLTLTLWKKKCFPPPPDTIIKCIYLTWIFVFLLTNMS